MDEPNKPSNLSADEWAAIVNALLATPIKERPTRKKLTLLHLRARQLETDVRTICWRNPQGTHFTQHDRLATLTLCARQLFDLGVRRKRAINLDAKDVLALVDLWREMRLSAATIRNRLNYLRWLARKIGKPHIVAKSNRVYGAGRDEQ